MQRRAVELASIAFAWSIMAPAAARAGEEMPAFSWEAPEGCPSSSDMEGRILARVRSGSGWTVRGVVHREASGFRVQLTTPSGERVLTASTCEQAADAAVVIVALAVDGAIGVKTAGPDRVARDEPRPGAPVAVPSAERQWGVSIGGAVDTSSLPEPSPGLGAGIAFGAGLLSLRLDVSGFLAQTKRASGDPPVSARVALVDALVIGCVTGRLHPAAPFDAGACAGGGVGLLPAESDGITSPKASIGVRPEVFLSLRAGWYWSDDLMLRIQGGPLLDPVRPPFHVEGIGDVYRPPPFSFRGSVGVEMRFR